MNGDELEIIHALWGFLAIGSAFYILIMTFEPGGDE